MGATGKLIAEQRFQTLDIIFVLFEHEDGCLSSHTPDPDGGVIWAAHYPTVGQFFEANYLAFVAVESNQARACLDVPYFYRAERA